MDGVAALFWVRLSMRLWRWAVDLGLVGKSKARKLASRIAELFQAVLVWGVGSCAFGGGLEAPLECLYVWTSSESRFQMMECIGDFSSGRKTHAPGSDGFDFRSRREKAERSELMKI